jgi:hypothetical protein
MIHQSPLILLITSLSIFISSPSATAEDKDDKSEPSPFQLHVQKMKIKGEGLRLTTQHLNSESISLPCPQCKTLGSYHNTRPSPPSHGIDRDFCPHNRKKDHLDLNIWTCLSCGFSNHKSFFNQASKLSSEDSAKIKEGLSDFFIKEFNVDILKVGQQLNQEDIPTHVKYSLMRSILPQLDLPWTAKADFFLNYAWIERRRLSSPISHPALSTPISSINEKLKLFNLHKKIPNITSKPRELLPFISYAKKSNSDDKQLFILHIYEAAQLNRLGYPSKASQLLKQAILMEETKTFQAIAQTKHQILVNEIEQLKEAIICIKEAIRAEEYGFKELKSSIYLLGELKRRIGILPESKAWLQASLSIQEGVLKTWSRDQLLTIPEHPGILPESEKNQISQTLKYLKRLEQQHQSSYLPKNITEEQASRWLREIYLSAVKYKREFQMDPESIPELYQLGMLKGQPDLSNHMLKFFSLHTHKEQSIASMRYKVDCLIPFSKLNHHYLYTFSQGKLETVKSEL